MDPVNIAIVKGNHCTALFIYSLNLFLRPKFPLKLIRFFEALKNYIPMCWS